jgi:hypothetical protein
MEDRRLCGAFFDGPSWSRWRAVVKAAFAEPMDARERKAFREVADRDPPQRQVKELVAIAGRGAGKDAIASLLAVCAALNFDARGKLRPGEQAVVMCLACDKSQAGVLFGYIRGCFETVPALQRLVVNITAESVELSNRVVIEVHTTSFRSIRGRSLLAVVFDEVAFWRDETSASPDVEVHRAVSPGLARIAGSMLIMISSAHKRSGLLYQRWADHYGKNSDGTLVVLGTTRDFNPTFDKAIIGAALLEDPQRYGAEYLSHWRDDLASYLGRDLLDAAVDKSVLVRPPQPGVHYIAGCDASGGRNDAFTAAIAHREKDDAIVLDAVFERKPPFNPSRVVGDVVTLMRDYRCHEITGDHYAAEWTVEAFAKAGAKYIQSPRDRSAVYADMLPIFTSGRARLLDNQKMVAQFAALERRTFSTGRERIDPGPGHDDLANSAAIAMSLADAARRAPLYISDRMMDWATRPNGMMPLHRSRTCLSAAYTSST